LRRLPLGIFLRRNPVAPTNRAMLHLQLPQLVTQQSYTPILRTLHNLPPSILPSTYNEVSLAGVNEPAIEIRVG
jgi:hypothetical protein